MDETALIAFGILMEETARELLGETGDFAFVEAAIEEEETVLDQDEIDVDGSKSKSSSTDVDSESTSDGSRYYSEESD